jgi:heptosyltransferase-2
MPISPTSVHSIVVRCPNWIGDAVMATPAFHYMRRLFPHAHVTAIAETSIAQLLEGMEGIDEWLVFSRSKETKRQEERRMAKELRSRKIDLAILLTRSLSSAWMVWKGGVRWRVGFRDHFRRFLLNMPLPLPKEEQHDVLTYLELLRPFGSVDAAPSLSLSLRESEREAVRRMLQAHGWSPEKKFVVLNPGAAYGSAKCWPKEYFREVAARLSREHGLFCVFIGDKKGAPLIVDILAHDGAKALPTNVINLAGKTSLRDLMAVLALADCVVTNDSGPMHIAAAFKRPLVALFGSTNPSRTGPWGCGTVLYKQVPCSPCYLRTCPGDFACMRSIHPDEVVAAVLKQVGAV